MVDKSKRPFPKGILSGLDSGEWRRASDEAEASLVDDGQRVKGQISAADAGASVDAGHVPTEEDDEEEPQKDGLDRDPNGLP